MSRRWSVPRLSSSASTSLLAVAAVLTVVLVVLAATHSTKAASGPVPPLKVATTETVSTQRMPPLRLPENPKAVFLGDSWTDGFGATPLTRGYSFNVARDLGWDATMIPGGSGTGYANIGPNDVGTYQDRLAALDPDPAVDVLVLQGGGNDYVDRTIGGPTYIGKIVDTIDTARKTYPRAKIVVMGPMTTDRLSGSPALLKILNSLEAGTRLADAYFMDPNAEDWLPDFDAISKWIGTGKTANHPNNIGAQKFADRFVADFKGFEKDGQIVDRTVITPAKR